MWVDKEKPYLDPLQLHGNLLEHLALCTLRLSYGQNAARIEKWHVPTDYIDVRIIDGFDRDISHFRKRSANLEIV